MICQVNLACFNSFQATMADMGQRAYGQYCGLAHALDVVGVVAPAGEIRLIQSAIKPSSIGGGHFLYIAIEPISIVD